MTSTTTTTTTTPTTATTTTATTTTMTTTTTTSTATTTTPMTTMTTATGVTTTTTMMAIMTTTTMMSTTTTTTVASKYKILNKGYCTDLPGHRFASLDECKDAANHFGKAFNSQRLGNNRSQKRAAGCLWMDKPANQPAVRHNHFAKSKRTCGSK